MVNPIGPANRPIYNPDVDQTKGGGHTHSGQPSQSTTHSHSTGSTPTATPAVTQTPQTQETHGHGGSGGHKGQINKIQDVTAPAVKKSWRGQFAMMRNGTEEARKKVMQEIKDMEKAQRLSRKKEDDPQKQNKKDSPQETKKSKKNSK